MIPSIFTEMSFKTLSHREIPLFAYAEEGNTQVMSAEEAKICIHHVGGVFGMGRSFVHLMFAKGCG